MTWPRENPKQLEAFYGPLALGADGNPTASWMKTHLTQIATPYPLALAWDPTRRVSKVTCHQHVSQSLESILNAILAHYGTAEKVARERMHLYGGCYQFRRIAGSTSLSMHAYGAAVDLDPIANPLGKAYDPAAGMVPMAVVEIFEGEGWTWGGRFHTRRDCMHFQAATP